MAEKLKKERSLPKVDTSSKSVLRVSLLLGWIAVMLGGAVYLVVWAVNDLNDNTAYAPEIVLPLIVIVGVIALLATLAVTAATFGLFDIADKKQALGLPEGSVQAVIALSLILIFAVVALYASGNSGQTKEKALTGLTQAEYEAIPSEEISSVKRNAAGTDATKEVTYDVVQAVADEGSKDINIQLLTTVSTLVVAVSGFYFGAKSAQEGGKSLQEGLEAVAGATRTLNVLEPLSPHEMKRDDKPLAIKVESAPWGAKLNWSVQGDDGNLENPAGDENFTFTPDRKNNKPGTATLNFEQIDEPKVSAALVVNLLPAEAADGVESTGSDLDDSGSGGPKTPDVDETKDEEGQERKGSEEEDSQPVVTVTHVTPHDLNVRQRVGAAVGAALATYFALQKEPQSKPKKRRSGRAGQAKSGSRSTRI